jgi:hypothetical protein
MRGDPPVVKPPEAAPGQTSRAQFRLKINRLAASNPCPTRDTKTRTLSNPRFDRGEIKAALGPPERAADSAGLTCLFPGRRQAVKLIEFLGVESFDE